MSESPIYSMTFFRPRETWIDAWIECRGIKLTYNLGAEFGPYMMARVLKHREMPDGDVLITEVGVRPENALIHTHESLDHLATITPYGNTICVSSITSAMHAAMTLIAGSADAWPSIACQDALIGRDFVLVDGAQAVLTDAGETAKGIYETYHSGISPKPKAIALTPSLHATLIGLRDGTTQWADLHSRTRGVLMRDGLTKEDGTFVETTNAAITDFAATVMERAERASQPKGEKKIFLTPHQVSAFEIVRTSPWKWLTEVPLRTRNVMTEAGWIMDDDDMPVVTPTGATTIEQYLAQAA
jgi:hypothetical protein